MQSLRNVRDEDLLHRLSDLVKESRRVEADVVAHNTLMAELDYGKDVIDRFRASAHRSSVPVDAYGDRITLQAPSRAPG